MKEIRLDSVNDQIAWGFSYLEFLEKCFLFKGMRLQELKKVANAFKVYECTAGEVLLEQGKRGDRIFIIVEGVVAFKEHDPEKVEEPKITRKLGRFEMFGENCFVHSTHKFLASVVAHDKLIVLSIHRNEFDAVKYQKFMFPVTVRIEHARRTLIRDGIRRVPFMKGLDDDDLGGFELEEVPAGHVFVTEGEIGDQFYILLSGEVVVTTTDEFGLHSEITRMEPKEFPVSFGEMSLVTEEPRNATITTLKPSTVFSIEKKEFQKILKKNSNLLASIDAVVKKAELGSYFANSVPIFVNMSKINQRLLGVVAFIKVFKAGEYVKRQNHLSERNFYLIESGSVEIIVDGEYVKTLTDGDYFGEIGLISNRNSSATVRVTDDQDLQCLAVRAEDFNTIVASEVSFLAQMKIRILGRNCSLEDLLQHPQGRESFILHCQEEFSRENVDFWQDVVAFENLERRKIKVDVLLAMKINPEKVKAQKQQMIEDKVKSIYLKYLKDGAPQWINLPASIRDPLLGRIEQNDCSYDMFNEAKYSIYALIEADNFQRYKHSEAFQELIQEIGTYRRAVVYK